MFTDHDIIHGYHAHIYYDADSMETARTLCEEAGRRFRVTVGRMHEKPVGPHPCWSCQLAFAPDLFDQVIPWLALNRGELVVFVHPETGDELRDHRDRALWMGQVVPLKLAIFDKR
jgi:DOPA 4,5-dioxygenase